MTATTTEPAELLIRHAWGVYEQDAECEYADHLRDAVWALEEAIDYGLGDLEVLARRVVRELSIVTADDVDDVLSPMPAVAEWLDLA